MIVVGLAWWQWSGESWSDTRYMEKGEPIRYTARASERSREIKNDSRNLA